MAHIVDADNPDGLYLQDKVKDRFWKRNLIIKILIARETLQKKYLFPIF